jgi:acetoin utilization protein AcuB
MAPLPRRVRDIMTQNPRTVAPGAHVSEAYSLMTEGGFRHVMVVEDGRVVGMLSDRDILRAMPPPSKSSSAEQGRFANSQVRSIMSQPAMSLPPEDPIENAVDMMLAEHISALAVVDASEKLLGVVTLVDVARLAAWLIRAQPLPPA